MTKVNLFDASVGIQNVMDSPATAQGIPTARPLAANVLREAGLEELYFPSNARHLLEQALCPDAGDGDLLRPEIFSANLAAGMPSRTAPIPPCARSSRTNSGRCLKTNRCSRPIWA